MRFDHAISKERLEDGKEEFVAFIVPQKNKLKESTCDSDTFESQHVDTVVKLRTRRNIRGDFREQKSNSTANDFQVFLNHMCFLSDFLTCRRRD